MSGEIERARRVLAEHQLDERGECLMCMRRRCQARSIAKAVIIGAGESLPPGCGPTWPGQDERADHWEAAPD